MEQVEQDRLNRKGEILRRKAEKRGITTQMGAQEIWKKLSPELSMLEGVYYVRHDLPSGRTLRPNERQAAYDLSIGLTKIPSFPPERFERVIKEAQRLITRRKLREAAKRRRVAKRRANAKAAKQ